MEQQILITTLSRTHHIPWKQLLAISGSDPTLERRLHSLWWVLKTQGNIFDIQYRKLIFSYLVHDNTSLIDQKFISLVNLQLKLSLSRG